jgi:aspartate/methionine/tyrosine aminotransferase
MSDSMVGGLGQRRAARTQSLTDFERLGFSALLGLADGHAYQDLDPVYRPAVDSLGSLWYECEKIPVIEAEERFRNAFALLSRSSAVATLPFYKICPTASNAIDIAGAVLADRGVVTGLIEPTFDNLSLILRRRRVRVRPISEIELARSAGEGTLPKFLDDQSCGAVFLVQPNNPTGFELDSAALQAVAEYCAHRGTILLLDNSFRFYRRQPLDDYNILLRAGVSFICIEDTGKIWPTHDLKASLIFCSPDIWPDIDVVYSELYLCHSRLAIAILERFLLITHSEGLARTIWSQVDEHRSILRAAIAGSGLRVDESAADSQISVEWLNCRETGLHDLQVVAQLAKRGLAVLPGRQFYWHSVNEGDCHHNIRISLMKPRLAFAQSMVLIRSAFVLGELYVRWRSR